MTASPSSHLFVSSADLIRIAKQLARANKSARRESATLSFDGHALQIEISGMRLSVAAKGVWTERVRVDADLVRRLRMLDPVEQELKLRLTANAVEFGDFSWPCERVAGATEPLRISLTSSPIEILVAFDGKDPDEIENSGLGGLVTAAAAKRDEAIERAFRHLVAYGVTRADLKSLVELRHRRTPKP